MTDKQGIPELGYITGKTHQDRVAELFGSPSYMQESRNKDADRQRLKRIETKLDTLLELLTPNI